MLKLMIVSLTSHQLYLEFLKGPLLFLIYINDLPNIIKPPIYASLFADYAKFYILLNPQEVVYLYNVLLMNLVIR